MCNFSPRERFGLKALVYMRRQSQMTIARSLLLATIIAFAGAARPAVCARQADVQVPSGQMRFGVFVAQFDPGGAFTLEGDRWPTLKGGWKSRGG